MHCVFQRFWHSNIRLDQDELLAEVTYCGTDKELCARMIVDPQSLNVRRAWWEVYRAPGFDFPRTSEISGLEGMTAYFNCGETLREALASISLPEAKDLFAEAVRGIIQAETFLLDQRGYASPQEYQDYWSDIYQGACHYYSNMERVKKRWYDHIGYYQRSGSLFNRMKSQTLYLEEKKLFLSGHLHDSFHSVAVKLEIDKDQGMIVSSEGDILNAPDQVCMEATTYMDKISGTFISEMNKKEIARLLGSDYGCVHLIDLVSDGAKTLSLFRDIEGN